MSRTTVPYTKDAQAAYKAYSRHWHDVLPRDMLAALLGLAMIVAVLRWSWTVRIWLYRRSSIFRSLNNLSHRFISAEWPTHSLFRPLCRRLRPSIVLLWLVCLIPIFYAILGHSEGGNWIGKFDLAVESKRTGDVAAALLPLVFALSMKNSPLALLVRSSHERLNVVHRWAGRTFVMVGIAHALVYTTRYAKAGQLSKLQKTSNVYGEVSLVAFLLLALTSVAATRRRAYRLFYTLHWILAIIGIAFAWVHDDKAEPYCQAALGLFGFDLCARLARRLANPTQAKIEAVGSEICRLTLSRPASKWSPMHSWRAGAHVFLMPYRYGAMAQHPFTVMSMPEDDMIELYVRQHRNTTKRLHSDHGCVVHSILSCGIDGPYGTSLLPNRLESFDRMILVAGGVGVTFTMPLLRHVISTSQADVVFLWSTNDQEFFVHIRDKLLDIVQKAPGSFRIDLRLFLTSLDRSIDEEKLAAVSSVEIKAETIATTAVITELGRPNVDSIVCPGQDTTISTNDTAVVCCAGEELSAAVRAASSSNWPVDGSKGMVWLYRESFDL